MASAEEIKKSFAFVLILIILIAAGCHVQPVRDKILFSFESDQELDRFHWKCHTLFSLSDDYATNGNKSLKLELFPSEFPGLAPVLEDNDWRGYRMFAFDVYNPQKKKVNLTIRIDDKKEYPGYQDRYNNTVALQSGKNCIEVPLDSLITSGSKRKLDVKRIYRVLIFLSKPNETVNLYFDNVRLVL